MTGQQTIWMRRKRCRTTNYAKRLKLLVGKQPRLVVRKSLHYISAQLITYKGEGDVVALSAHTKELPTYGYKASPKNICAAYLLGLLLATKARKAGIKTAVLDCGLYPNIHGNKIYATLKGAIDGGISIPHEENALPPLERITGKHIATYAPTLKGSHHFSKHPAENITTQVQAATQAIKGMK
ncbi:50S ribosomal protein L18 [Candidatus Woesearchaeota archaeon]|nr:50S ribosomal protein L18 [Candidatus Woesearchaeota archaeon]